MQLDFKLDQLYENILVNHKNSTNNLKSFQDWLIFIMIIQFGIGFITWDKFSSSSHLLSAQAIESFTRFNHARLFSIFQGYFDYIYIGVFLLALIIFTTKRFSKAIVLLFLGNLVLLQTNYLYDFGDKVVLNYWLFFLSLSHFSNNKSWKSLHLTLIQLQLGAIYLFGALTKVADPIWWRGEGIIHLIMREKDLLPILDILSNQESLLIILNYLIIFFELTFIFLCRKVFFRGFIFGGGLLFHLLIAFIFGHWELSLMFLVVYLTFLPSLRPPLEYFQRALSIMKSKVSLP